MDVEPRIDRRIQLTDVVWMCIACAPAILAASPSGPATVGGESGAVEGTSIWAGEEGRHSSDVRHRNESFRRLRCEDDVLNHLLLRHVIRLRLLSYLSVHQRGADKPWTDRIARDIELGVLKCHNLGKTNDTVFRSDVGSLERRCYQAVHRCDVDDAAEVASLHLRQSRLNRVKVRGEVQAKNKLPTVIREVLDRHYRLDACVIHQDVQSTSKGFLRGFDQCCGLLRLCEVRAMKHHLDSVVPLQTRAKILYFIFVAKTVQG
mmetsp:Transcript_34443/g.67104  ORF Transcript_34443/g.67104 Transcript_34443/m.67104 type:complete len:262 (+) Transcript_34443:104-889(+)